MSCNYIYLVRTHILFSLLGCWGVCLFVCFDRKIIGLKHKRLHESGSNNRPMSQISKANSFVPACHKICSSKREVFCLICFVIVLVCFVIVFGLFCFVLFCFIFVFCFCFCYIFFCFIFSIFVFESDLFWHNKLSFSSLSSFYPLQLGQCETCNDYTVKILI